MAAALPPGDPRPVNQHPRTVIGIDRRAARIHINADDLSAAFALQCRILSPAADMIRHTAKGLNRKHPAAALPQISCRLRTDQPAVPDRRLKSDHIRRIRFQLRQRRQREESRLPQCRDHAPLDRAERRTDCAVSRRFCGDGLREMRVDIVQHIPRKPVREALAAALLQIAHHVPVADRAVFRIQLTDQPDAVLSTIVSRSQRIDLPLSEGLLDDDAYDAVEEVLSSRGVSGVFEKAQAGRRLAEILSEVKDEAEDEDVAMARKAFYRTVMKFVRGWMVKGELPRHQAFRNVSAVEDAFLQSERYLSDDAVLCNLADRLVWPV